LDGAILQVVSAAGGDLVGGPPRWVWHTYEADPHLLTAVAGARALRAAGHDVHFVFNPLSGQVAQMLPAYRSARALKNRAGGVQTNRLGSVCLQVEVIGFAEHPFTSHLTAAGRAGLGKLVAFARAHGIPDVWPMGSPPEYPRGYAVRDPRVWTSRAGHYGHSQVPENDHGDPGAIDIRVLWAAATPALAPSAPPAPHPISREGTMLFRAKTASADGSVPQGAIMSCAAATRWHIPGIASPLVAACRAADVTIVEVDGQDIVEAFPVDAGRPHPGPAVTVDVAALAAEIVKLLPA
jgi:hypothetical protein